MNCPSCNTGLNVAERQGVEIDVCPQCRGVWLDRGELDKIIERYDTFDLGHDRGNRQVYRDNHHPRRKSFWQELFD